VDRKSSRHIERSFAPQWARVASSGNKTGGYKNLGVWVAGVRQRQAVGLHPDEVEVKMKDILRLVRWPRGSGREGSRQVEANSWAADEIFFKTANVPRRFSLSVYDGVHTKRAADSIIALINLGPK
jgi:hypothetical protein